MADVLVLLNSQGALYVPNGGSGYSGQSGFSGYSGSVGTSGFSGYSGSVGTSGFSGYSGSVGTSGFSGYSGSVGTSGFSGYSGSVGTSGFSGYSGSVGTSGFSGYSGSVGTSGFSGYSGSVGTSGFSGYSGPAGAGSSVLFPNPTTSSGIAIFSGTTGGGFLNTTVTIDPQNNITGINNLTAGTYLTTNTYPLIHQGPLKNFANMTMGGPNLGNLITIAGLGDTLGGTYSPSYSSTFGWIGQSTANTGGTNPAGGIASKAWSWTSGLSGSIQGYNAYFRFDVPNSWQKPTGVRFFVGLTDQSAAGMVNGDLVTGNYHGLNYCTSSGVNGRNDAFFQFASMDGTTRTSGITTIAPVSGNMYDLYINQPNDVNQTNYIITNVITSASYTGSITTHLPTSQTALAPCMTLFASPSGASAGTTNKFNFHQIYVENLR